MYHTRGVRPHAVLIYQPLSVSVEPGVSRLLSLHVSVANVSQIHANENVCSLCTVQRIVFDRFGVHEKKRKAHVFEHD